MPFFSKNQLEEIKNQAMAFWQHSTNQMASFFSKVNDYNRLYHVKLPKELESDFSTFFDRSQMVPPDIYNNIVSLRGTVGKLLFQSKPYATVTLEGQPNFRPEYVIKAERKLSDLLDISAFPIAADLILHQALVCGVSCCFTEWARVYRYIPNRGDNPRFKPTGSTKIHAASYPKARAVDIRRVRIDDKAENFSDIRIVAYHVKTNISDLITWNNDPNNPISFDVSDLEDSTFQEAKYYEYVDEEYGLYGKTSESGYGDKPVELMDFRGIFRVDGEYKDLIVKIANRNVIIEARPNDLPIPGYELFDFATIDAEINRMYPMGVIEPAEDIFIESFIKRNQSIDASNRNTYEQYIADAVATAELPSRIPYRSGGLIKVNLSATGAPSVSNIFTPVPRVASYIDTFEHALMLKNEVQQTMRQSDYKQGIDPSRKETATAVDALMVGGRILDELIVRHFTNSCFANVGRKYLILHAWFQGHQKEEITLDDGTLATIGPGELDHAFQVSVDVSSSIERPAMVRRIIEAAPFLMNDPMMDPYQIRHDLLWALNWPNVDKALPNPGKKEMDIERENMALMHGILIPVHPLDDHMMHIESHREAAIKIAEDPDVDMTPQVQQAFDRHSQMHIQYVESMQNPGATKKSTNEPFTGQTAAGLGAAGALSTSNVGA